MSDKPPGDPPVTRYFLKRNHPGDPHAAIYRIDGPRRTPREFSFWINGEWQRDADIGRQYWTGFDADVDEVSEAEALEAIRLRKQSNAR